MSASGLHNWFECRDNGTWLVFDSSKKLLGFPGDWALSGIAVLYQQPAVISSIALY